MNRRDFLSLAPVAFAAPALAFQQEKSKLKITGIRLVKVKPAKPAPSFTPAPGSWSTGGVEVANPMSIYPEYKPMRSLFMADGVPSVVVEVTTDKGVIGYGSGGPGAGPIIEGHLTKLMKGFADDVPQCQIDRTNRVHGHTHAAVTHG